MTPFFLTPQNSALLVVDIQERLMNVIHNRQQVIDNTILLLKTAHVLKMPILSTTQYAARIGNFPASIKAELPETPIDKMEFSCFGSQDFVKSLDNLSPVVRSFIICGVETHICIYQTALDGLLAGYRMLVPADAVSSRTTDNYQSGLQRIQQIGGEIINTEMVIYELLKKAGTNEFKTLLPLLK
ncbi:isochorismatase family protein [Desulfobacterota bacterium M19]